MRDFTQNPSDQMGREALTEVIVGDVSRDEGAATRAPKRQGGGQGDMLSLNLHLDSI